VPEWKKTLNHELLLSEIRHRKKKCWFVLAVPGVVNVKFPMNQPKKEAFAHETNARESEDPLFPPTGPLAGHGNAPEGEKELRPIQQNQ